MKNPGLTPGFFIYNNRYDSYCPGRSVYQQV